MKIKSILATLAVALGVSASFADDPMHSQAEVERGVWCSNFAASKSYADANNIPMILFWANPGCSQCEKMEHALNNADFKAWQARMNLVMVFSYEKTKDSANCKKFVKNSSGLYPYMAVYWKKNTKGAEVLAKFSGRSGKMTAYGAKSSATLQDQFMTAVEKILSDWDPGSGSPSPDPDPDPVYYTVKFVVDPAKGAARGDLEQLVESGKGAVAPSIAEEEGWEFTGWDKAFNNVTADLTVTAEFKAKVIEPEPEPAYYTVNFVVDAEKGVATGDLEQRVEIGKGAIAPVVEAKENWKFTGWDKSFSKVTADLTVNAKFEEVKPRKEVAANIVYKKSRTLSALVYEDGEPVGTASLKLSKLSKKGVVKVSLSISEFAGLRVSASFTAKPNVYGDLEGSFPFKSKKGGPMACVITYNDGDFTVEAENDLYSVELGSVKIGGAFDLDSGESLTFSAEIDIDLGDSWDFVVDPPFGEPVYVRNGTKFSFDKVPTVKYKKYREDGETWYELTGIDDEVKTNVNALKLTYKPATGVFSGSFKVYASNENSIDEGRAPKLKALTVNVSGIVVNGEGFGVVKYGNTVGSCTLQ